jgi:hypothetical protein
MATRTITPEHQLVRLRAAQADREAALEDLYRSLPIGKIMDLVGSLIALRDFERRLDAGEVRAYEVHVCDAGCERDEHGTCPLSDDD